MQQNFLSTIRILWFALLSGQIMLLVITQVIQLEKNQELTNFALVFTLLGVSMAFLGKFIVLPFLLKNNLKGLESRTENNSESNSEEKEKNAYKSAFIASCAVIEGGNLLMIMMFMLTQHVNFLVGITIGLLLFLTQFPVLENITSQIEKAKIS